MYNLTKNEEIIILFQTRATHTCSSLLNSPRHFVHGVEGWLVGPLNRVIPFWVALHGAIEGHLSGGRLGYSRGHLRAQGQGLVDCVLLLVLIYI